MLASGPSTSQSETIGHSVNGLPLIVKHAGELGAALRIFIMAGQHGDEPDSREAALRFLNSALPARVQIAVLADTNPDGALAETRRSASDVDLNRDHLLLTTPEIAAVHSFVDRWHPDLILDVHTYRPWRKELLPFDVAYPQDVMIDFPTNPAVRTAIAPALERKALEFVTRRMAEAGIRCDRYTLIRPGIVRHSNVDILDARNSLALRFGVPVILIEGRRTALEDLITFPPPHIALLRTLEAVMDWAAQHAEMIRKHPSPTSAAIPIRCHLRGSDKPCYLEMLSVSNGNISKVRLPGTYLPIVKTAKTIRPPLAYGVPRKLTGVREALTRHRFQSAPASQFRGSTAEWYRVESIIPPPDEDSPALPNCSVHPARVKLSDYLLYPSEQPGGTMLTLLLEPESQFGFHRIPNFLPAFKPGSPYPIIRLE